jgi:hypothetical protein
MIEADLKPLLKQAGDTTTLARLVEALVLERAAVACQSQAVARFMREPAYVAACDDCAIAVLALKQALPEAIIRHEQRELLEDAARYRWIRDNRHAQVVAIRSAIAFSGYDHEFDDEIDRLRGRRAST